MKKTILMLMIATIVAAVMTGCTPATEGNDVNGASSNTGGAKTMTPPGGDNKGTGEVVTPPAENAPTTK